MCSKIFVYEFISGGGFNNIKIPSSLFCEGFGMLRSIVDDFKYLDLEVISLLDNRIRFLSEILDIDSIKYVESEDDYKKEFLSRVKESEYCFIIAPEFSNILSELSQIVIKNNKKLLSVNLKGIEIASSKYKTYKYFLSHHLKTPETYLIPLKNEYPLKKYIIDKFKQIGAPIIIKPDDGVGAESIIKIENESELNRLLDNFESSFEKGRNYIIQKFIRGKNSSISLLNSIKKEKRIKPIILSINTQNIQINETNKASEYLGGETPIEKFEEKKRLLEKILKKVKFTEFGGLYGIDFILKDTEIFFLEINPRLTTSYIGIRKILTKNPVKFLMNLSGFNQNYKVRIIGTSIFTRIELIYSGPLFEKKLKEELIPEMEKKFPEFITPPIAFDDNRNQYSCFVATKEKSLTKSREKIASIKSYLQKKDFIIKSN
ncbi:MAG: ATP-grasp domain-containing protein [Promethearchaeati archaeon]